jgi:hypothetical protein
MRHGDVFCSVLATDNMMLGYTMKPLPADKWTHFLLSHGETGMGYTTCDIILKNGNHYSDAMIVEGNITKIRGLKEIPFEANEIEKIIVTHNRWNWNE